jgi:hypothetical protein
MRRMATRPGPGPSAFPERRSCRQTAPGAAGEGLRIGSREGRSIRSTAWWGCASGANTRAGLTLRRPFARVGLAEGDGLSGGGRGDCWRGFAWSCLSRLLGVHFRVLTPGC